MSPEDAAISQHVELSRRYHLQLAKLDADLRHLESQIGQMTLKEYHERFQAIQTLRGALKVEWEKAAE